MSFIPNFSISQNVGLPNAIMVTDTSLGVDVDIVGRRVYMTKADGTFLVPQGVSTDYVVWDLSSPTIVIDALNKDYALRILVSWVSDIGIPLYSKQGLYQFPLYGKNFIYTLTQDEISKPRVVSDSLYYKSKQKLFLETDNAQQAIDLANNQYSAQAALDRENYLRLNESKFF